MAKIVFLGDVFCEKEGLCPTFSSELYGDCCVLNYEGVYDNGALTDSDAAPQKTNLKGTGNPFGATFKKYIATLANNHILDYTQRGCESTLRFLSDNGVQQVGLTGPGIKQRFLSILDGVSIAAYMFDKLKYTQLDGCAYAVEKMDEVRMIADARLARAAGSRFHVISLHWGTELLGKPWPNQVATAHRLVDSGAADMILGMHPHCLQPVESYKGKYIFYSIGNAVFSDFKQPSKFANGVPANVFGCSWGQESKMSIVPILNTEDMSVVPLLACSRGGGRMSSVHKTAPILKTAPQVTRGDAYLAVCRRFLSGVRLLLRGDLGTAQFHFKASIASFKSYSKTLRSICREP